MIFISFKLKIAFPSNPLNLKTPLSRQIFHNSAIRNVRKEDIDLFSRLAYKHDSQKKSFRNNQR